MSKVLFEAAEGAKVVNVAMCEAIIESGLHCAITVSCIKAMANGSGALTGNGDNRKIMPKDWSIDIVSKGFQDEKMEDLRQISAMVITGFCATGKIIGYENGELVFNPEYDFSDLWVNCKSLIENYMNQITNFWKRSVLSIEVFIESQGNFEEISINARDFKKFLFDSMENPSMEIINHTCLWQFYTWFAKTYPKQFPLWSAALPYMLKGYTDKSIIVYLDTTLDKLRYCKIVAKKAWNEYNKMNVSVSKLSGNSIHYKYASSGETWGFNSNLKKGDSSLSHLYHADIKAWNNECKWVESLELDFKYKESGHVFGDVTEICKTGIGESKKEKEREFKPLPIMEFVSEADRNALAKQQLRSKSELVDKDIILSKDKIINGNTVKAETKKMERKYKWSSELKKMVKA